MRMALGRGRRLVLCADFDETLTARDTISLLFQCAAKRLGTESAQEAHAAQVQALVTRYASDLRTLDTAHLSPSARAQTPARGTRRFDAAGLEAFLAEYAALDLRSIRCVESAGVLRGIVPARDLLAIGSEIALRPDALRVLALADAAHVVSSNWSATMLEAAVNGGRRDDAARVSVITNDLEVGRDSVTTGEIRLRVQSPSDKANWVERIRADEQRRDGDHHDTISSSSASKPLLVFVGDSANDLLAMMAADVGISLKSDADSSIGRLADHFGVALEPLHSGERTSLVDCERVCQEARARGEQVVFTARSWAEIAAAVTSSR